MRRSRAIAAVVVASVAVALSACSLNVPSPDGVDSIRDEIAPEQCGTVEYDAHFDGQLTASPTLGIVVEGNDAYECLAAQVDELYEGSAATGWLVDSDDASGAVSIADLSPGDTWRALDDETRTASDASAYLVIRATVR